jgi:hypothetical protein
MAKTTYKAHRTKVDERQVKKPLKTRLCTFQRRKLLDRKSMKSVKVVFGVHPTLLATEGLGANNPTGT